jgi:hypothetical protein
MAMMGTDVPTEENFNLPLQYCNNICCGVSTIAQGTAVTPPAWRLNLEIAGGARHGWLVQSLGSIAKTKL